MRGGHDVVALIGREEANAFSASIAKAPARYVSPPAIRMATIMVAAKDPQDQGRVAAVFAI